MRVVEHVAADVDLVSGVQTCARCGLILSEPGTTDFDAGAAVYTSRGQTVMTSDAPAGADVVPCGGSRA